MGEASRRFGADSDVAAVLFSAISRAFRRGMSVVPVGRLGVSGLIAMLGRFVRLICLRFDIQLGVSALRVLGRLLVF